MLKIKEITIERFRSIKNIKLNIDASYNQTALCGQNNVGKTNTLRAINLFFNPQDYQQAVDMPRIKVATGGTSVHPKISLTFVNETDELYKITRDIARFLSNDEEGLSGKKNNQKLTLAEVRKILKECEFVFIESVNVFMPGLIDKLTEDVIDVKYDRARFSHLKKELKVAYDAYVGGLKGILDEFAKEISGTFKNFQSSWSVAFSTPQSPQKFRQLISDEVSLELDDSGSLGILNKGAGLQRLAAILLYFEAISRQRNKKNVFVCIDEPDVYLHEGLQRKLKKFFDEKTSLMQLFYTTHSKTFVNPCNLQNVFLLSANYEQQYSVRKQRNINVAETKVVDITQEQGYEMICEHLGIERDEYEPLKQNNIIVEGNCDKNYITGLCKFFGLNIPNIISLNGCSNAEKFLNFYESYYRSVNNVAKPKVKLIFDNDAAGNDAYKLIKKKQNNYPHIELEVMLIPNFLGEIQSNNPNNEIEDFLYPEVFCFLLNNNLCRMKLKKLDEKKVCLRLTQNSFKNQGILAICETLKNEENPEDGTKVVLTISSSNTDRFKESLAENFKVEGNKKLQLMLTSCDKKYPKVREYLQNLCSFT